MRLILGSGSPRRRELLGQLGVELAQIVSPDIDETPRDGERPRAYCLRMAIEKANALDVEDGEALLSADTTVALGLRILGKPSNEAEARSFLERLSGRRHTVITAVAVRTVAGLRSRENVTSVRMKRLSDAEIAGYLASNEWRGKAGGYAIQGRAAAFIPWIQGSFSGVMGLPLSETAALLDAARRDIAA